MGEVFERRDVDGNLRHRRKLPQADAGGARQDAPDAPVAVRSVEQELLDALAVSEAVDAALITRAEGTGTFRADAGVAQSARQTTARDARSQADVTLPETTDLGYSDDAVALRERERHSDSTGSAHESSPDGLDLAVEPPTLRERGMVRYSLGRRLGRGGMAEVFEARELTTGQRCAVKVIRPESTDKPRTRARFRREAELMQRVEHPNVARCMGLREADDGTLYMVLEYVDGMSLKSLIRQSDELGARTAVSIILQLLRALDAVHNAGLVHRDIKPSNIMLTRDEDGRYVVKLIDFGLADVVQGLETATPAPLGRTLGTPAYVAPEQAMGLDPDPRSDVYSASAVLYEMFTGVRVFRARSVNHLVLMHLHDKPVPLRARAPWLSKDLAFAVMKGLRKRQETRYPSAREFARTLARAMRSDMGSVVFSRGQ